jgi:iron complex transport system substrate-binding protein
VEFIGTGVEPNIEATVALEPDLIVVSRWFEEQYEAFAQIAPTIAIDDKGNAFWKLKWHQHARSHNIRRPY